MILIYFSHFVCTLIYKNTNVQKYLSLIDRNTEITVINTDKNINLNLTNSNKMNVEVQEIKTFLVNIYLKDRMRFKKIKFVDESNSKDILEETDTKPSLIIICNLRKMKFFKDKDDLIAAGCKNHIYKLGMYYFCKCEYSKCGLFCQNEKNHLYINVIISVLIILLFVKFRKKSTSKITRVYREVKEKQS